MGSIEEQLNNVNNKDEMIKWLVNEYQYLSDKAYGMVHKDIRQREMDIIKGKADELMNEIQTESDFHNQTIETNVKGIKIKISGKTIEEIIKEQLEEIREKTKPIIKAMYEIQRNFDKLDQKDKDEILEMLGNKNKSKEESKENKKIRKELMSKHDEDLKFSSASFDALTKHLNKYNEKQEDNWRSLKQRVITDYITLRRTEERDDNYDIETILGELKRLEKTGEDMDWLDDTKEFEKVYNDMEKETEELRQWRINMSKKS